MHGRHFGHSTNEQHKLFFYRFDFVVAPIIHPRYRREYFGATPPRPGPLTRSDKVIKVSEWSSLIVAKLSPWIQLDSSDEVVRRSSEKVLKCVDRINNLKSCLLLAH